MNYCPNPSVVHRRRLHQHITTMFRLVVFSVALTVTLGQKCCTPPQWEGGLGEIAASVSNGSPHLVLGNISLSYDYTNNRLASSNFLMQDGQPKITKLIQNYQTMMQYDIVGSQCTASRLTGSLIHICIPDNAVLAGQFTYGAGADSLRSSAYLIQVDQASTLFVSTTVGNPCIPIGEVFYGNLVGVPTVETVGYYDITPGIRDPSVFSPPSSCTGLKYLHDAPVVENKLLKYFLGKATKA